MTYLAITRTDENARESRPLVRVPEQSVGRLFQGWGPKF